MLKFLKRNKLIAFLMTASTVALAAVVVSTVSWYSVQMQITPDVDSGIILSYFDSGDGSQADPYVITRPAHYYNLVRLMNRGDYEGFNGNSTYFEFGKDLDNSGTYKFYNYDNSGVEQSGYSTSLNMNYYSDSNALSPLGCSEHPFYGNIEGHNLTISNLHITGKGKTDIGVFGYVGIGAKVNNLYLNSVDIDLNVTNVNEINDSLHDSHSSFTTFGYIAGHTYDKDAFNNVYINNSSVRNSGAALPSAVKNNFGYIGYCDSVELPNVGEEAYKQSFDAGDVYNYLDSNYSSISGHSLVTRNTEYSASGTLSTAISSNSGHYTFNSANSKNYSLATAGYQEQDHTYIAEYRDGASYNMMTGATVTSTAPANQTSAGAFVYYDSTNSKWTYYTTVSSGSPVSTHYNVYYLSYHGITAGTSTTTYYLKYDNGSLGYTTTAPTSYASTPDYYFAFTTTIGGTGVAEIRDGVSNSFYIYSPSNEKYLYAPTGLTTSNRNTLLFGDSTTIQSATCEQNMFTISGSSGTSISLSYNSVECKIAGYNYSTGFNDPKFRVTDGQNPAFTFVIHGDANESGDDSTTTWSFVKTASNWTPAANDVIAIVNETNSVAMSKTQNSNNRGEASVSITNSAFVPGADVGRFKLGTNGSYPGKFSLQDVTPNGPSNGLYLHAPDSSGKNYLRSTASANTANNFFVVQYNYIDATSASRGEIRQNQGNHIFSCYDHSNNDQNDIVVYLYQSATVTIHYEGALDITESGESSEVIEVDKNCDIYYYDEGIGTSSREQLTSTFVSAWSLSGLTTYVTISPEIVNGWNLVQSQSDLIVGEKYAIAVYKDGSNNNVLKSAGTFDVSNGYFSAITSTFNADGTQITTLGDGSYQFILNGNSTNGYTLSCSDGQLFADTTNTKLSFVDGVGLWDITISSGTATITAKNTSHSIKYNSNRFKTYTSGQTAIRLYRYDTTEPKYIGDKIGNGYNPDFIDTVGSVDYYSSYMRMNGSTTRSLVEGTDLNQKFYNTKYTSKSLVIRIPNRGSLDYGTVEITCGSNAPVFMKNGSTSVTLASVGCTAKEADNKYHLYLNKYNIYNLSYCTLNSSGNINGCYDNDGDEIFSSGAIDEFVLILGAPSATNVDISHIDVLFSEIKGNLGDFGRVGFRDSPGVVPGEIFSFTYDLPANGYVYSSVSYNSATNTYDLYFKSTSAITLYVYNYDANRAIVRVNGTRYYGPYNAISISASASPGTSGWTSYS